MGRAKSAFGLDVLWPLEVQSGAIFQPDWLRGLHTGVRHAVAVRQGQGMVISAAPGNFETGGVVAAHWRDALRALGAAPGRPA